MAVPGQLFDIFDLMLDPIVVVGADQRIAFFNSGAERAFGYERREVIGQPLDVLLPHEAAVAHRGHVRSFADSGVMALRMGERREIAGRRRDGTQFPAEASLARLPGDGDAGFIAVLRDVSERRLVEAALRDANLTLESRVRERTAELQEAIEMLSAEVAERARVEATLKHRSDFEDLITGISTRFINTPSGSVDEGITRALGEIGAFAGVDRSYLFLFAGDGALMDNTHEWCAPGIEPQVDILKGVPIEGFPWWMDQLERYGRLYIPRVADLPEEAGAEREILKQQDIRSLVVVALVFNQQLIGFLGFDSVREEKVWPEPIIALLRIVGEVFVNAIQRQSSEEALLEANDLLERRVEERTSELLAANSLLRQEILDRMEAEERFRQLAENIDDLFYVSDLGKPEILYISPAYEVIWGRSCQSLYEDPRSFVSSIHPDDRPQIMANLKRQLQGEPTAAEYRIRRPDGAERWVSDRSFPIKDAGGRTYRVCGIAEDITERRSSEVALRESEERYRRIVETANEGIWMLDAESRTSFVNRRMAELLGYAAEEMQGRPLFDFMDDSARDAALSYLARRQQGIKEQHDFRFQRKDGRDLWAIVSTNPILDRDGRYAGTLGMITDITERKEFEAALQESEELLSRVFYDAPIGMAILGSDRAILRVNKALCEMLNYSEEEVASSPFDASLHPMDASTVTQVVDRLLAGEAEGYRGENRLVRKDGRVLWADTTAKGIRHPDGRVAYALIMLENVTERKRAELLEEEQRHIAYELHDGAAQLIASAHQHLQAFAHRRRPRSLEGRQDLDRIITLVRSAVGEVRRVIGGLRPTALDDLGLAAALRLQVEALRADGWEVDYDESLGSNRLPAAVETALFRVAQEALSNVRKHSGTTRVGLELSLTGNLVRLRVRDGGRGFDASGAMVVGAPGERLGLRGMMDRVGLLGGDLLVDSAPGGGTRLTASVPLPQREEVQIP